MGYWTSVLNHNIFFLRWRAIHRSLLAPVFFFLLGWRTNRHVASDTIRQRAAKITLNMVVCSFTRRRCKCNLIVRTSTGSLTALKYGKVLVGWSHSLNAYAVGRAYRVFLFSPLYCYWKATGPCFLSFPRMIRNKNRNEPCTSNAYGLKTKAHR